LTQDLVLVPNTCIVEPAVSESHATWCWRNQPRAGIRTDYPPKLVPLRSAMLPVPFRHHKNLSTCPLWLNLVCS